jgi:YD repeat-containing protein
VESAGITDREKAGLRGPVRTSVEEAVYPTGKFLTATEYSLDGKLLTTRTSSTDGSEWLTTQTYDANGQLAKVASGRSGEPGTESLYSYDETGRLLSITNHPQKGSRIEFRYDGQGRKTASRPLTPKRSNVHETLYSPVQLGTLLLGPGSAFPPVAKLRQATMKTSSQPRRKSSTPRDRL